MPTPTRTPDGRIASITFQCKACGKNYHPWTRTAKPGFCSQACYPAGREKTIEPHTCENCGKVWTPTKTGRRFCSRNCYLEFGKTTEPKLTAGGYVLVYAPDEPGAYPSGQILEHRLVMQRAINRPLEEHETVHHIDGNTSNNELSNLQLRSGRHGKGVKHMCRDCGSSNVQAVPL